MPAPNRSSKGFVGILVAELHFPESGSLKGKRMHLRRVRDQVTRRYGASFAEVAFQDVWQRSRILVVLASSDLQTLEETMGAVRRYLDEQEWVLVSCGSEVMETDA